MINLQTAGNQKGLRAKKGGFAAEAGKSFSILRSPLGVSAKIFYNLPMKNLMLVLTVLLVSKPQAWAGWLSLPIPEAYESGRKMCETTYQDIIEREKGFFVTVPADYSNPAAGSTDIYAYFSGGYRPEKDTVLYMTGGPGQPAHWGLFNKEMPFNVLIMEHRGVGCSRPSTRDQYLDPSFYSSENVARDAEMIRRHLNISKWSVYGVSYGTVPATIYGSLFPSATRAVILEGVVFSGDLSLWEGPHRRKILQKMVDSLPRFVVQRLEKISTEHGVPPEWFSVVARGQLMYGSGLASLREKFLELIDDSKYQKLISELKGLFGMPVYEGHPLFVPNEIPYYMIGCQEMNMASDKLTMSDSLVKGKLVPLLDKKSPAICQELGARRGKTYQAFSYPLRVPVTYFQGGDDGATPAPEAVYHYKQVPQGLKQLMILVEGGHNPNLQFLMEDNEIQLRIYTLAIEGKPIPPSLVKELNAGSEMFWALAQPR